MAKKRKATAPPAVTQPAPKPQLEEPSPQKPKPIPKHDPSSSSEEEDDDDDEDVEDVEEEVEEEESESEENEDEDDDDEEEEEEEEEEDEEEEEEEEEDEESKRETLRQLLEPFGKDQIVDFLKQAASKDPSIITRITQSAESDPAHRKIFVHGLAWDATTDQVLSVFKQYGEIEECKVVTDKLTGRAKGYGFVLFKTRNGAQKSLKQSQKKIGARMTSCQLASAGPIPNNPVLDSAGKKIYVANVGSHVNPEKLRSFFAKFGEIEEGPLGQDPLTGKLKGFALFIYKTAAGCKKVLEEPVKMFEGNQLQCRRWMDKNQSGTGVGVASIQQSDVSIGNISNAMNYVNPGMVNPGMVNPGAVMMGQNPGMGLGNPMMASALSQTGLAASAATGFSPAAAAAPGLGFGGGYGINSISPSAIGSYGPQVALQGLGAYQNTQLGHSSAAPTAVAAPRSQSGVGSVGTAYPSYFGR